MDDDRQFVAAVQRSGADDSRAGPAGIGIVDARETDRTGSLARGALTPRRGKLEQRRLAGDLKLILRQDELDAEGAPGSGLAVAAMAGVHARKARERRAVPDSAAAAAAFYRIAHSAAAYIGLVGKATRRDGESAFRKVSYVRVRTRS